MEKLIEKLKNKTFKDSVLTLAANAISQVFSFIVTIIMTRSLSIYSYGIYSIVNNISSFVSDLADLGMNSSITRFVAEYRAKKDTENENNIIIHAIRKKALSLSIIFIILILFSKPIATYLFHDVQLYYFVYFIFLSCVFSLFVGAMRSILQGRQEFEKYFIAMVTWNIVWAGAIVVFFLLNKLTVFSSLFAGIISGGVNLILCSRLTNINISQIVKKSSLTDEIKTAFNKFGNWMVLWSIFALLQSKVDVFLLATLTTTEQVSYYDVASKIIKPVLMVVASYSQVLNPIFASMYTKEAIKKQISKVMKFILSISLLIIVGIFMVGPVVSLVFGAKYGSAILPAQLLLFAIIFYIWTVPFNSALYALNKPYIFTFAALAGLIVTVIGDFLLLSRFGAVGASITYMLAQIVGLVVAYIAYKKNTNDIRRESL